MSRMALATLLVLLGGCHAKPEPRKTRLAMPSRTWLDVASPDQAGALPSVVRAIDAACGFPKHALDPHGHRMPAQFDTLHDTLPMPHPYSPGRYAMQLDPCASSVVVAVAAACEDAGACTAVAAFPPAVTSLDSSWASDGGAPYWCDAGACGDPPQPSDDWPGVTP